MYCVHTYVRTSQSCRLQYVVYLGTQPRRTAVKLTVGVNWAKRLHHDVFEGDTGGQMVIHEAYHVWGGRWEWQEVWQGARTEWQSSSMSQTKWQHGMTWWYSDKLHETSKVDKHINGVTKLTNMCDAVKLIQAVTIGIPPRALNPLLTLKRLTLFHTPSHQVITKKECLHLHRDTTACYTDWPYTGQTLRRAPTQASFDHILHKAMIKVDCSNPFHKLAAGELP